MGKNPINDFVITKEQLSYIGKDLYRPECILAERNDTLWCSDARGGVVRIAPDGTQSLIASNPNITEFSVTSHDLPNGLCFTQNKDILIANFGSDRLEVLDMNGKRQTVHESIDGVPIGKVNFVLRDSKNRIWVTVSTRHKNWLDAFHPTINDGYIILIDDQSMRIVADNLSFTNEIRLDDKEEYIYISETCGRRISRMKINPDGSLKNKENYGPSDLGIAGFPDGIIFDDYGNLWGTLIFGEKIFAITPGGDLKIIFDDGNPQVREKIDESFFNGNPTEELLLSGKSSVAPLMTSLTFGGKDLDKIYIGSVLGKSIPYFHSPVKGKNPIDW